MSLATRCTACGTIFRVVQDQLRVSEGWVRCGRCAEVFNAQEQVFDIDAEPPPPWPAERVGPTAHTPPAPAQADDDDDARRHTQAPAKFEQPTERVSQFHAEPPAVRHSRFEDESAPEPATAPNTRHPDERREPEWGEPSALGAQDHEPALDAGAPPQPEPTPAIPAAVPTPTPAPVAPAATPIAAAGTTPSFLRPATQQASLWRRPATKAALIGLALTLTAGLALQAAWHFRDAIAALEPRTTPALQSMCGLLDCDIQPWRRIDVVSVETSALTQAGVGNNYQLSLTLRNKSGVDVASPWVDLSLTDSSGSLVARRMLSPSQFTPSKATLTAGADLPLQLLISTGELHVTGYSVEIFHP